MRIFSFALAAVIVLSGSAQAQKTHSVKSGQTLSHIAAKYGVSQSAILRANKLSNAHKLKLGQKLRIPAASKSLNSKSGKTVAKNSVKKSGGYTVRNGDYDGAIAKKFGTTVDQLHRANPGVNWRKLQIGQSLKVPGSKSAPAPRLASSTKVKAGGSYSVKKNDNDWIIARRVGTTPSKLRAVNPSVNWTKLQIGQRIRVPGSGASGGAVLAGFTKINTRHAKIAKDNVKIRKNASTNSQTITTVPKGTYVTVLDRESGWYKLKFPKGTVGWVRGDMLTPLASKQVARASSRSRRNNYVASNSPSKYSFSGSASLAVLDHGYSMLGVRYRFGGSSRSGTDCSGFVLQCYRSVGVKLPRTSREMSKVGAAVPKSQLKPGDLVFFATRRSSRVGHVGIYRGNGSFIHSSSSGGSVRIDNLSDGYYSRRYVGARRVTKNPTPGKSAILAKKDADEEEKLVQEKIVAKGETGPAITEPAPPAAPKTQGTDEIIR